VIKWSVALAVVAGLVAVAYVVREQRSPEGAGGDTATPRRVQNNVVKLGARLAESYGLKDEPAQAAKWQPRLTVYGRVVPNPRATVEIRAPFAGTLQTTTGREWPALGNSVKAGQPLGRLDIRVGPQERLDLGIKLNEARITERGAEEVFAIRQERLSRLQSAGVSISRSERDEALVQFTEAKTQLAKAREAVRQWQDALDQVNRQGDRKDALWSQSLTAPAEGQITELAARPGMAVEPGGLILRLVDFRRPLVRLDIPLSAGPPASVELGVVSAGAPSLEGPSNRPEPEKHAALVPAVLVGAAPQVETASQLAGYWYEVDTTKNPVMWRPGLFVKAHVKVPDSVPQPAIVVPEAALLYHQGRALVYVCVGPGRYERREVQVLGRDGDRWLLAGGVAADERVVSQRAQVLLSEEFRGEADND
jgi:hypothetical protein